MSQKPYSYHNFILPFTYSGDLLKGIENWTEEDVISGDKRLDYNTLNYFYPSAQKIIFNKSIVVNSIVVNYKYKFGDAEETKKAKYIYSISTGKEEYKLEIDNIRLKLYKSYEIGILIFETKYFPDDELSYTEKFNNVLNINQYGRRIKPPFFAWEDKGKYVCPEAPLDISIIKKNIYNVDVKEKQEYLVEKNDLEKDNVFKISAVINWLFGGGLNQVDFKPVIDDRMFVMSLIRSYEYSKKIENAYKNKNVYNDYFKKIGLYNYVFVDKAGDCSCQDDYMYENIMKKSVYSRWVNYGTFYGVSHHSFVGIIDEDEGIDYIKDHFSTMYKEIVIMVLVQRTILISYNDATTKLSENFEKSSSKLKKNIETFNSISDLQKKYVIFNNQFMNIEPTAQEQGIELYNMIRSALYVNEEKSEFENQLSQLHGYADYLNKMNIEKVVRVISFVGLLGICIQIGCDVIDEKGFNLSEYCISKVKLVSFSAYCLILLIIAIYLFGELSKSKKSKSKKSKSKNKKSKKGEEKIKKGRRKKEKIKNK